MGTEEFARSRVGQTIGRYRLDGLLGFGGMAAVYRGRHRNGNRVAIKLLHPELSTNTDIRARFLKEGYSANAVEHPGAVRVIDDDVTEDGTVFVVMELLEGETVDARWTRANRRMEAREVLRLMHQLLGVLASAHANGIVHRDIKPENLFVTRENQLKVLDFGIARMRDASKGTATMTANGRMMGSPAFMPREQALGLVKEIDARTDIWAVGATMFTLLSGSFVHEAETMEGMIVATATQPPRSLAVVAASAPCIVSVVDRALAFERDRRYPDASTMQSAIDDAHVSLFGERLGPPRGVAVTMDATIAPTLEARLAAAQTVTDDIVGETKPMAGFGATVPATMVPHVPGVSTTAGTSHEPRTTPSNKSAVRPRRSRAALVIGAVGVTVLAVAIPAAWRLSHENVADSAISTGSSSDSNSVATPTTPLPPSATPVPREPASAVETSGTADAGAKIAIAVATANRPSGRNDAKPVPPAPSASMLATSPVGQPSSTARPNCDPWFYYDTTGKKVPKPGCR